MELSQGSAYTPFKCWMIGQSGLRRPCLTLWRVGLHRHFPQVCWSWCIVPHSKGPDHLPRLHASVDVPGKTHVSIRRDAFMIILKICAYWISWARPHTRIPCPLYLSTTVGFTFEDWFSKVWMCTVECKLLMIDRQNSYASKRFHVSKVFRCLIKRPLHHVLIKPGEMLFMTGVHVWYIKLLLKQSCVTACSHMSPCLQAVHDYEHGGCTNDFLILQGDVMALTYNDKVTCHTYVWVMLYVSSCMLLLFWLEHLKHSLESASLWVKR